MPKFVRSAFVALTLLVTAVSGSQAFATAENTCNSARDAESKACKAGRPLTAAELGAIYAGRTWMWSTGGAYFDPRGRLSAVVGDDAKSSYIALGSWSAGSDGRVCLNAVWRGRSGLNNKPTCFYHRMEAGRIMQKKGSSGAWYTFKSAPVRREDEANKLVQGDRIYRQLANVHAKYLAGTPL